MPSSKEQCLRCGNLVTYVTSEDGTFCPKCGWSREAAQSFAKTRPSQIRGHFAKSMLKAAGFGLIITLVTLVVYWQCRDYIRLAADGVPAVAEIRDFRTRHRRRRIRYEYDIAYAGQTAEWTSRARYEIGTRFQVLYLPAHPSTWAHGDEADSAWSLSKRECGIWGFIVAGCILFWTGSRFLHHTRSGIRVLSQKNSFESELTRKEED